MNKVQLLVIDPQNDFHDQAGATLPVNGAMADAERLADLIKRKGRAINSIDATLDTHQQLDIAHAMTWVNSKGENPAPFTIISADDVRKGVWRAYNPALQKRFEKYVEALETNARYPLVIWPYHTLVGTWGHNVVDPVMEQFMDWERRKRSRVNYTTKGHNPWTEHYSGIMADVPDSSDPTTQLNTGMIKSLQEADVILLSGQALSHCLANTVRDIANNFGEENIGKLVLIEDTSSPVAGFENLATDFLTEMKARGMQTAKASEIDI